ncbi:hypothetical protein BaRGS_00002595 [Batillaria attramentaria]|uniref:Uncharacterized protein n=1 Tax=Batillaria attramentaria TaxID=370345 RepID=A0ABD0M472_9CAEN
MTRREAVVWTCCGGNEPVKNRVASTESLVLRVVNSWFILVEVKCTSNKYSRLTLTDSECPSRPPRWLGTMTQQQNGPLIPRHVRCVCLLFGRAAANCGRTVSILVDRTGQRSLEEDLVYEAASKSVKQLLMTPENFGGKGQSALD